MKKSLFICCLLGITLSRLSAQSEKELGDAYFKSGDCAKVMIHYPKALQEGFDKNILKNYIQCASKERKWQEAENLLKKQADRDRTNEVWYLFFAGQLEAAQHKRAEAEKKYNQAIQGLALRSEFYTQLIEEFRSLGEPDFARKIVLKARQQAKNDNLLRLEMAGIYKDLDQPENMIRELLTYGSMIRNPDVVQGMLQDFLKQEKDSDLFEKVLYQFIQERPNESFYNELLIWHQIQKKDFYKAFIQERALDKRMKYNGARVMELARIALQNQDYGNATTMYEYLLKEYPGGPMYSFARRMAIFTREQQVRNTYPVRKADVEKLINDYQKLLDEVGVNSKTQEALRNMAKLQAFYMNDPARGIALLTQAIELGKADQLFVDNCKLDLGDIYVLENEPWEASLLFSQVEKSQKADLLGYEAKLKNAKVHYYTGDFDLAKSVLDILKRATSREIANDASALSLLIADNTGYDSTDAALKSYASVELKLFQQKYGEALDSLKRLYVQYRDHSLADEILWLTAGTYMKLDSNQQAADALRLIMEKFDYDILGDNAVYTLAVLSEEKLGKKEEAMELYQRLIEKYPGSVFVADARKRYRNLRGDTIN